MTQKELEALYTAETLHALERRAEVSRFAPDDGRLNKNVKI